MYKIAGLPGIAKKMWSHAFNQQKSVMHVFTVLKWVYTVFLNVIYYFTIWLYSASHHIHYVQINMNICNSVSDSHW